MSVNNENNEKKFTYKSPGIYVIEPPEYYSPSINTFTHEELLDMIPLVIKNYRGGDKIGNNLLIEDSYTFIKNQKDIEFITAITYLRNKKLKKLNKWEA